MILNVIPPAELKALEDFFAGIETPGIRLVCALCQADLPGSDPSGHCVRYGVCSPACHAVGSETSIPHKTTLEAVGRHLASLA